MDNIEKISETLKRARLSRGWSRADASANINVSAQHLSRIENGHLLPSEALLQKMVEAYQVPEEDRILILQEAGYLSPNANPLSQTGSSEPGAPVAQVSNIKIDAFKTPIVYTNALFVSSDQFGVTIDAGQRVGPTNEIQIVARIGFSHEHAAQIYDLIGQHIRRHIKGSEG